ncbi:tyrosine-type recombinase/integrase [Pseudonocardia sp. CA-142604]|uniref:tyrosine-type recombinase/integrase n=1 Tax=Pseudonocardia sp. CA-142604 TaxID=3240024 RepID=UPI003D94BEDB
MRTDSYVEPSRRTVAEFLAEWLTTIEAAVKPTTFANYSTYANAYVIPIIGPRLLQDIDTATVNALYRHLLNSGRSRADTNTVMYQRWRQATSTGRTISAAELASHAGVSRSAAANAIRRYRVGRIPAALTTGLSPSAVASIHIMFRRALRDAVAWRYLTTNPAAIAQPPRGEKQPHKTWNPQQLATFLQHARHERLLAMWLLFATTGMRRSEAVGARRDALDMAAGTLSLVTTHVIAAGRTQISSGKTRRSRRLISLDAATLAALRDHLATLDQERAAWGPNYQDRGLLFCWPDGRPIYPDTITEQFGRLVTQASLPIIRLHDVRHTYATMALRAGVNPKIVSTRLGHATVAFTLDTYTADIPELDRAAAEQITGLFLPPPTEA